MNNTIFGPRVWRSGLKPRAETHETVKGKAELDRKLVQRCYGWPRLAVLDLRYEA